MTTKYRIISGFALLIVILAISTFISSRGLNTASTNFVEFNRLAHLNVALSDMQTQQYMQAFYAEMYLGGSEASDMDEAITHLNSSLDYAKLAQTYVEDPANVRIMQAAVADLEKYIQALRDSKTVLEQWRAALNGTVDPALADLVAKADALQDLAVTVGHDDLLDQSTNMVEGLLRFENSLRSFIDTRSQPDLDHALAMLDRCEQALLALEEVAARPWPEPQIAAAQDAPLEPATAETALPEAVESIEQPQVAPQAPFVKDEPLHNNQEDPADALNGVGTRLRSRSPAEVLLQDVIVRDEPVAESALAYEAPVYEPVDMTEFRRVFDSLDRSFRQNSPFAVQAEQIMDSTYAYDDNLTTTVTSLNATIDQRMGEYSVETLTSNERASFLSLAVSIGGIILGLGFAVLTIFSLIKVLEKMGHYAGSIAHGDFSYNPKIKEKGEIGALVSSLDNIPQIFNKVTGLCSDAALDISRGFFRSRLSKSELPGDFGQVADAVNNVADSYTRILDELPISLMAADTERKITFLNAKAQVIAGGNTIGEFCGDKLGADICGNSQCVGKSCAVSHKEEKREVTIFPGGQRMDLDVTGLPLVDLQGKHAGSMEIINDISQIRAQQILMRQVADEASAISDRVASASEQLAAQVEQVSRGTDIQRQRIESTASAMTEMNATVIEVARNAGQASEQSEQTRASATQGADLVNQVVGAINEVNRIATKLMKNMEELGEQADSIGEVISVISNIADQTNLLALNAAIEAARAGEAGRGFAVVADEVRKLAESTMSATQEVNAKVTAIQDSARINIEEVNLAGRGVQQATEVANSSGQALDHIVKLASGTSEFVASIATAAEEQSATSDEITHAVAEVNHLVQETSDGMIQASAAVQDLARVAQELRTLLAKLQS